MKNIEYIKKKFPKAIKTGELLTQYLDSACIIVSDHLYETDIDKVFGLLVGDYLRYKIDPDELANLCEKLYIITQDFPYLQNTRTVDFLLRVADLEIYLREDFDRVPKLLDEIIAFSHNSSK